MDDLNGVAVSIAMSGGFLWRTGVRALLNTKLWLAAIVLVLGGYIVVGFSFIH